MRKGRQFGRCFSFLAVICLLMPMALSLSQGQGPPAGGVVKDNMFGSVILPDTVRLMVGDRGKIYRSEDSGKTWLEIRSGTRRPLFSVSFPDAKSGWVCGNRGVILHSADGGLTWSGQESGTDKHLFAVDFTDGRHGAAVGDWGAILLTEDGGATWQDVSVPEDVVLYGVRFAEGQTGWIAGECGAVFRTGDGGRTWSRVDLPFSVEGSFFCVEVKDDCIYLAGLDGRILTSKDAGNTWKWSEYEAGAALYSLAAGAETVWAVGENGTVALSTDRGIHWRALDVPGDLRLFWFGTVSLTKSAKEGVSGFFAGANGLRFPIEQNQVHWGPGGQQR